MDFADFAVFALAWLSSSGQTGWNQDCDVSDPKDNVINLLDLEVFVNNWLAGK